MPSVDIEYDYIDFEKETKHAHFVVIEDNGLDEKAVWLPKSQIEIDENHEVITMPEWLAQEKELI